VCMRFTCDSIAIRLPHAIYNSPYRYSRLMERARVINENADDYIEWFRRVFATILKWDIKLADTWNMDELGAEIGISHKSYVIVIAKEKDVNHTHDGGREWVTFIETINVIGQAMKPFFIVKSACILEDYRDLVIKSGYILACTKNGWSNNDMALKYI
jgi:hypothetical protein